MRAIAYYGKVCGRHPDLNGARLKSRVCPQCAADSEMRHRQSHERKLSDESKAKRSVAAAKRYIAKKEAIDAYNKAWAKENKEKVRVIDRAYKANNRAKLNALRNQHAKEKPEMAARHAAKRRAVCSAATPAWGDNFFLEEAYLLAKKREVVCGGKWHVDHIVPLISKQVCGLHVYTNIQVIRAEINRAKGNKHAL